MKKNYIALSGLNFRLLGKEKLRTIRNGAFRILEEIGMKLTDERSKEILNGAGAKIDGSRVYLPSSLVSESIDSAPDHLILYDQNGDEALDLQGYNSHFGASVDGPTILDPQTNEYRDCYEKDIGWIVGLVDEMKNISFLMPAGFAADRDSKMAEVVSAKQCMLNTDKPLVVQTESLKDLKAVHRMAVKKSGTNFQNNPFFINYAEPISPLVNPDNSARKTRYCAREEIPLLYSPFLAMGATAPQSRATAVAQACAESLFGLTLQQQVNPGAPFVFGGMPSMMDMNTANFSYGAPDMQVMSAAVSEMGHYLGLPVFGTAGIGDSKRFDGQAIIEGLSSVYMAALSGANLIHDVGLFGSAKILIPEMIVAIDEMIELSRHNFGGLDVDEEVDINLLEELGPGGEFVSHEHTLNHFRESWYPKFIDRTAYSNQKLEQVDSFHDRIADYVEKYINERDGKKENDLRLKGKLEEIEATLAAEK